MDEKEMNALRQLLPALKALAKSVEHALLTGAYQGTGDMAVKSYRSLHNRIAELLPEDYYVTQGLALDISDEATEQQKIAQVNLAVSQLSNYLEGLVRNPGFPFGGGAPWGGDIEDLKDMTRGLRDRILEQTKQSIRRAMADIDVQINMDDMVGKPKSKRRVVITSDEELAGADLSGQDLTHRNFSDKDLTGANLSGSTLDFANFSDSEMEEANLSGASLQQANLSDCKLRYANLSGSNLAEANLSDSELQNANLSGANLERANLSDSDLREVNMSGAHVEDANLRDSDLRNANLAGANLSRANLRDANLQGANLRDATLQDTNLRDADLNGATLPDGSRYERGVDLARFGARGKMER
jgi:uncharacterized protein YjbI with pentapeptide repeats